MMCTHPNVQVIDALWESLFQQPFVSKTTAFPICYTAKDILNVQVLILLDLKKADFIFKNLKISILTFYKHFIFMYIFFFNSNK